MKLSRPWAIGMAACGICVIGLLAWPIARPKSSPESSDGPYRGAEHQTLQVASQTSTAVFRLSSSNEPVVVTSVSATPTLVGVVGGREAYLRSSVSGEVTRVSAGALIDGWRVIGIDARSVTVAMGQERQRLTLFARATQATVGTPQPAQLPTDGVSTQ